MVFPLDVSVYEFCNHQAQNHYLAEQRAISTFSKKGKIVKMITIRSHVFLRQNTWHTTLKKRWTKIYLDRIP